VKDTHTIVLGCQDYSTLAVGYVWDGHPATQWWMVLTRDGAVVYKSPAALKP
jgi:hypothetical protein